MTGRTIAYCFDCKRDLCKPNIRECAEDSRLQHTQVTGHAVGVMQIVKPTKSEEGNA